MKLPQKIQFFETHLLQIKHPLCHKLLQNKNETTILNTKSKLQTAASNDDEMELNTASIYLVGG